jgi:hypothetical protein
MGNAVSNAVTLMTPEGNPSYGRAITKQQNTPAATTNTGSVCCIGSDKALVLDSTPAQNNHALDCFECHLNRAASRRVRTAMFRRKCSVCTVNSIACRCE